MVNSFHNEYLLSFPENIDINEKFQELHGIDNSVKRVEVPTYFIKDLKLQGTNYLMVSGNQKMSSLIKQTYKNYVAINTFEYVIDLANHFIVMEIFC